MRYRNKFPKKTANGYIEQKGKYAHKIGRDLINNL